ncbi:hypothetical protein F4859DRAFT_263126 [Xylaria cf. heliscus]|nr:hypothetical protein F4859DRAFT_263126 [Xylaria cf. heliscus]
MAHMCHQPTEALLPPPSSLLLRLLLRLLFRLLSLLLVARRPACAPRICAFLSDSLVSLDVSGLEPWPRRVRYSYCTAQQALSIAYYTQTVLGRTAQMYTTAILPLYCRYNVYW